MKRLLQASALICASIILSANPAVALTELTQDELIHKGINAYEINPCGTDPVITTGGAVEGTPSQVNKVKTIIGVAKTLGLTPKAALIAFMTVFQESGFRNYGNPNPNLNAVSKSNPNFEGFPGGGGDHDSVGIFQQQSSTGWSTFGSGYSQDIVWQIMGSAKSDQAVAYSAQAFFGTPPGRNLPTGLKNPGALKKGLVNRVPNYNDPAVSPGKAAQTVQISAYPDAYNKHYGKAQALVDQHWNDSPAIPLAVPLTAGSAPGAAPAPAGATACNSVTGHGAAIDKILSTVVQYAWPEHCNAGEGSCPGYNTATVSNGPPTTKKDAYAQAVSRGGYNGGCTGVDCGAFVTHVMRGSGADPQYNNKNAPTDGQWTYLKTSGKYKEVQASEPLQPGDIGIRDGHTLMYVGKIPNFKGDYASASLCDRAPMAGNHSRSGFSWYRLIVQG